MTKTADDLHEFSKSDSNVPPVEDRLTELEERILKLETALAERSTSALTEDALVDRVIAKLSAAAGLSQPPDGTDRVLVLASSHDDLPQPPKGAVLHPPEAVTDPSQRTWFLAQLLAEFRLSLSMYFDPRYRISRTAQFVLPGIAILFVVNYFLERALDVLLCVIGYTLITRELGRYRDVLSYLSRYGHR
jgi:hypothetical protein